MVVGHTTTFGPGGWDVYLIKTDSSGDTLWTKAYGESGSEWGGIGAGLTNDGGYIIAGCTNSFGAGGYDVYLIKTDADGNSGCNEMSTTTSVSRGGVVDTPATLVDTSATIVKGGAIIDTPVTIDSILCYSIIVFPVSPDFIADDTMICAGDSIDFTDLSTGTALSWRWDFPGAVPDSSTDRNPVNIRYDSVGTYDVTLIVNDTSTLTKINYITVEDCDTSETNLFVPNAFSPNGDEVNDILFIRGSGIKEMTFIIYNRWGEKVFKTNDINPPAGGWNGTHRGEKMAAGVYVYYLTGEFIGGESFERKGNITLVR